MPCRRLQARQNLSEYGNEINGIVRNSGPAKVRSAIGKQFSRSRWVEVNCSSAYS